MHVAVLLLAVVAVTVAIPFFFAVTVPEETVAIDVSEELQVIPEELLTVTEHVLVEPLEDVAVIVALPLPTPVTTPLVLTVATEVLLDFQVTDVPLETVAVKDAVGLEYPGMVAEIESVEL